MKRVLSFVLFVSMCFSLVACGSADTNAPEESESTAPVSTTDSNSTTQTSSPVQDNSVESEGVQPSDELGEIEVEQNLFDVELTIPASFVAEGTTQETLDAEVETKGFESATLNDDGSITYIMTKAQHEKLMDEIKANIDQSVSDMVTSGDYPTFKEITTNGDYTEFTVVITSQELGFAESFSVLAFYMYGGMYHAFNGTESTNVRVVFMNADTGAVIHEANSSEMAE